MSALRIKNATWYALLGLFVAVAILPILKLSSPQYFPSANASAEESFADITTCKGKACDDKK